MMTSVFLVRHGQTQSNTTGHYMGSSSEDLNATGYTQARRLSRRLSTLQLSSVYTSPLHRAHTTAAVIAEPHHLEPKPLDALVEINLGEWEGLRMDEIRQKWPDLWRQWRLDPSQLTMPGGEGLSDVTARSVRAFENIVEANEGQQSVVVTHDVVVKVLVAHVLGASNGIYRSFEIANASLTEVRALKGRFQLITLNDTSHLEESAVETADNTI